MLEWGLDVELRSPPRKKGGQHVATPVPSSPSSPSRPGRANGRGSVPDRFIPRRSSDILDGFSLFEQRQVTESADGSGTGGDVDTSPAKQDYRQALRDIILPPVSPSDKILPLTLSPISPTSSPSTPDGRFSLASPGSWCSDGVGGTLSLVGSPSGASPSASARKRRNARLIPKSPDKILDAPDIVDDYYLNLLDWSPNNILAVALGQSVFLWNATTGATHKLVETTGPGNIVTSLTWGSGNLLAVGTHSAEVRRRSPPFFLFFSFHCNLFIYLHFSRPRAPAAPAPARLTRAARPHRCSSGTWQPTPPRAACAGSPPPSPRTKWTRRVPHPVLIGHAASLGRHMSRVASLSWASASTISRHAPPPRAPARRRGPASLAWSS